MFDPKKAIPGPTTTISGNGLFMPACWIWKGKSVHFRVCMQELPNGSWALHGGSLFLPLHFVFCFKVTNVFAEYLICQASSIEWTVHTWTRAFAIRLYGVRWDWPCHYESHWWWSTIWRQSEKSLGLIDCQWWMRCDWNNNGSNNSTIMTNGMWLQGESAFPGASKTNGGNLCFSDISQKAARCAFHIRTLLSIL